MSEQPTLRALLEEQQQDVRLYHAELMTTHDVIDRAGLRAIKLRNILNAADVMPEKFMAYSGRFRLIPDPLSCPEVPAETRNGETT